MDQQPNFTTLPNILDLSVQEHSHSQYEDQRLIKNKANAVGTMSEEESKIRGELENEIETDLEEEIKDGIYHLALRLHRLYQHQKERNESGDQMKKKKTLSEVNISIRMEGGTKIEINETKKEAPDHKGTTRRPWTSNNNKFDWAKSLRSAGTELQGANNSKSNRRSNDDQANLSSNKHQGFSPNPNVNTSTNARRNLKASVDHNKVLELGWKW